MDYLQGFDPRGFIDSTGRPIRVHYRSIRLDRQQRMALDSILRPRPRDVRMVGYASDGMAAYRDAIIFKDRKGRTVAWINIGFLNEEIMFVPETPSMYGFHRFTELRQLFENIGLPRPIGEI